jgi:uncharacterized sporulation protein YeaH/YhbH (DUF444 family)
MTRIIDRRQNTRHKSAVNRQRFLQRFKRQIKKSIDEIINQRSIMDIDNGEKITIPTKDITEPSFKHGRGGFRQYVYNGNKEFEMGDRLPRPETNNAQQRSAQASNNGVGVDDFMFEISKDELLDLFFEDLALPDLIRKQITKISSIKKVRAGFTSSGSPNNINIIRSLKRSLIRRKTMGSSINKKLIKYQESNTPITSEIDSLQKRLKSIPFIHTYDLRYNNRINQLAPTTQAVMFCLMDVSGSMDKAKKYLAKRFFILLYLFLKRNYDKIAVVFIRHHTSAKEVSEEEFFYSRETGGTVVSSALQMMKSIINERYSSNAWNIYAAQASDGDNWNADSPHCSEILNNDIMPHLQYFSYVEIMPRLHQSLWEAYIQVKDNYDNFAMETINDVVEIYPVFRELFKRQTV